MKIRLTFLYLLFLIFSFTSCSDSAGNAGKEIETQTINSKATNSRIEDLKFLEISEIITPAESAEAQNNVRTYESKNWVEKYWVLLVLLLYISGATWIVINANDIERESPLSTHQVYLFWLMGNLWGLHFMYLWGNQIKIRKKDKGLKHWKYWLYFSFPVFLIFIVWQYPTIITLYKTPIVLYNYFLTLDYLSLEEIVCILFFIIILVNVFVSLIFIPYWVYLYNCKYYRHHYENGLIISGNKTSFDKDYENMNGTMMYIDSAVTKIIDELKINHTLEDPNKDNSITGYLKRFGKNIITLGASGRLNQAKDRLRYLQSCCETLQKDINRLETISRIIYSDLGKCRKAAYRNLFLAKELIVQIKSKMTNKNQELLKDNFAEIFIPQELKIQTKLLTTTPKLKNDNFVKTLNSSINNSLNSLNAKIEMQGKISKNDIISEAISTGLQITLNSISNLIDYNKEISDARKRVQNEIDRANKYITEAAISVQKYNTYNFRALEIMIALTKCNKAFVNAYEPICEKIFGKPSFKKFLFGLKKDNNIYNSIQTRSELNYLISVCSEYNKINSSKI